MIDPNVQVGMLIQLWPEQAVPAYAMLCEGQLLQQADYPELHERLQDHYSQPEDPVDTFRVPDLTPRRFCIAYTVPEAS